MKISPLFFCLVLFCSCDQNSDNRIYLKETGEFNVLQATRKEMNSNDYLDWFNNKGAKLLLQQKEIGPIRYSLIYKPSEYEALKSGFSLEQTEGLIYFTLRLSSEVIKGDLLKYNIINPSEYSNRVTYYSFEVVNDICLVSNNDTILCEGVFFERTFGIGNDITLTLNFLKPHYLRNTDTIYDQTLIFNDHVFGGGRIQFYNSANSLSQIPKLQLQ